jgi:hypothetical protein
MGRNKYLDFGIIRVYTHRFYLISTIGEISTFPSTICRRVVASVPSNKRLRGREILGFNHHLLQLLAAA